MDVLSEVLKVVKLQGAMFYNGEFSSPWSFCSPASHAVAPYVAPAAGHVIIYHLLTEGRASARLVDGERIILNAGDIVVFPHGDSHILENGPPTKPVDMVKELNRIFSQGLKLSRSGGGGEITKFVCGFMACEPRLSQVFLSGLPPVFKVSIRNDASGRWLENSIRFSGMKLPLPAPVEKQSWRNFRRCCLLKLCGPTLPTFQLHKRDGWLALVTPRSERHWR
jgi:hypothetical protein